MRQTIVLVLAIAALTIGVLSVSATTSYVARLTGHGAARWTPNTSVYVNLSAMTPGVWKQQIWSGTCAKPGVRRAVLPGLVVPSTGTLAKTTKIANLRIIGDGIVLRLLQGQTVVCGSFVAPLALSLEPSSSVASPVNSLKPTFSTSPSESSGSSSPEPVYSYGNPY
jgi:hypothetical protein